MPRIASSPILRMIRRMAEDRRLTDTPDQELLRLFLNQRDEAAFGALLRRHGSMVLHVCRNVLGNEQDAEDAFQATFLIFAQKGRGIRKQSSVGSWLHGVAYHTAMKARGRRAKVQQRTAQTQTGAMDSDDFSWREVQQLVHEELNLLSERYRAPLVHCYLEGKTQEEAAALLGVSKATVRKHLERGRALLRARLIRRGLGPAAILAVSAWPAVAEAVPGGLLHSTINSATLIRAGATVDFLSPSVVALTEGVLKAMFLTKIKVVSAVVLAALLSAGVAGLSYQAKAQTWPTSQRPKAGQAQPRGDEQQPPPRADRSLADEVDALRLEIDALRKEVRAMRERFKVLESERGQNHKAANSSPMQPGGPALNNIAPDPSAAQPLSQPGNLPLNYAPAQSAAQPSIQAAAPALNNAAPALSAAQPSIQPAAPALNNVAPPLSAAPLDASTSADKPASGSERPYDAFAEAEAALKKLRQNPHDKQAAEALEKATRRLKARAKVSDPARIPR
jgi:RNA polymerase sigma factor (sigma-70 family)